MRTLMLVFRQGLCQTRRITCLSNGQVVLSQFHRRPKNCFLITPQYFRTMPALCNNSVASFEEVKSVKNNPNKLLIDVREPSELQETGTIPGSINIPLAEVEAALRLSPDEFKKKYGKPKPDVGTPIIFSCKAGIRSDNARQIALKLGFKNSKSYDGGWLDWEEKTKSK